MEISVSVCASGLSSRVARIIIIIVIKITTCRVQYNNTRRRTLVNVITIIPIGLYCIFNEWSVCKLRPRNEFGSYLNSGRYCTVIAHDTGNRS